MTIFQAIILGIIQGLTEFLPVSSSGHLILLPKLLGWQDQGLSFDVIIHLGTLLAVVLFFRHEIFAIIKSFFLWTPEAKDKNNVTYSTYRRLAFLLCIGIVPVGIVGFLSGDWIESHLRSPFVIACTMIFWGIMLGVAEWYSKKQESKNLSKHLFEIKSGQALCIGLSQVLSLVPGTSRSGITMTGGLFAGLDKQTAARFSFLMSVPLIFLAAGLKLLEWIEGGIQISELFTLGVGFLAALLSGIFAIQFLLKIIQKWSFTPFVVYRIIVGIVILLFVV